MILHNTCKEIHMSLNADICTWLYTSLHFRLVFFWVTTRNYCTFHLYIFFFLADQFSPNRTKKSTNLHNLFYWYKLLNKFAHFELVMHISNHSLFLWVWFYTTQKNTCLWIVKYLWMMVHIYELSCLAYSQSSTIKSLICLYSSVQALEFGYEWKGEYWCWEEHGLP